MNKYGESNMNKSLKNNIIKGLSTFSMLCALTSGLNASNSPTMNASQSLQDQYAALEPASQIVGGLIRELEEFNASNPGNQHPISKSANYLSIKDQYSTFYAKLKEQDEKILKKLLSFPTTISLNPIEGYNLLEFSVGKPNPTQEAATKVNSIMEIIASLQASASKNSYITLGATAAVQKIITLLEGSTNPYLQQALENAINLEDYKDLKREYAMTGKMILKYNSEIYDLLTKLSEESCFVDYNNKNKDITNDTCTDHLALVCQNVTALLKKGNPTLHMDPLLSSANLIVNLEGVCDVELREKIKAITNSENYRMLKSEFIDTVNSMCNYSTDTTQYIEFLYGKFFGQHQCNLVFCLRMLSDVIVKTLKEINGVSDKGSTEYTELEDILRKVSSEFQEADLH